MFLYFPLFGVLSGCVLSPKIYFFQNPYPIFSIIISVTVVSIILAKENSFANIFRRNAFWIDQKINFIYFCASGPLYYSTIIYYLQIYNLNPINSLIIISLTLLFIFSLINPFLIPYPFLINAYLVHNQNLLNISSATDKLLPITIISSTYILLVIDYFLLSKKIKEKSKRISIWIYSYCFITACSYFAPGLGKLFLGNWIMNNSIDQIYLESLWKNGFNLFPENKELVANFLRKGSVFLLSIGLIAELLPFFAINFPRVFVLSLLNCVLLHLGIFIFSGILFWKWIIIDLSLITTILLLLNKSKINYSREIFSIVKNKYRINVFIIGFSTILTIYVLKIYTSLPFLAWYDPQNSWMWEFKIKSDSGIELKIPPKDFTPFSLQFAQHRWNHIFDNVPKERLKDIPRGESPRYSPNGSLIIQNNVADSELLKEWNELSKYKIDVMNKKNIDKNFLLFFNSIPQRICKTNSLKNDYIPVLNHIWSGNYYSDEELRNFCKDLNKEYNYKISFLEILRLYSPERNIIRKSKVAEFKSFSNKTNF